MYSDKNTILGVSFGFLHVHMMILVLQIVEKKNAVRATPGSEQFLSCLV